MKATRASARRTPKAPQKSVPPQLLALAAMLNERNPGEVAAALTTAQAALREFMDPDKRDGADAVFGYISHAAETSVWEKQVERAIDVDPGNMEADLTNAYGIPALLVGLSFAWLMLSGGGSR